MIWTSQAHFTTLYHPINQGNSETQRKLPPYFQQRALGFTGLLYAYTSMLGLMRFGIQTFDFNTVLPNLQRPHENSKLTLMIFAHQ